MKRIKKKLLAMTLGAVFTFASFSAAFAADPLTHFDMAAGSSTDGSVAPRVEWQGGSSDAAVTTIGPVVKLNRVMKFDRNIMKEALADLVTAGTITQTQSDDVLTYFQNNAPEKPGIKVAPPSDAETSLKGPGPVVKIYDPLENLVDEGTITQDQARAIRDKMKQTMRDLSQQQLQANLDALAAGGTITRDQAGKILDFLAANGQKMRGVKEQAREDMQNMREQTRDMSPQERKQYFKQNMQNLAGVKDPVSQMVEQGIITQQQADDLKQTMRELSRQQLQANLNALAAEGTITQEQTGKILDFLAANEQKMRSVKEQAREDMQKNLQNLAGIKDPVSQMVEQGIVTQQQADAVRGALAGAGPVVFFLNSSAAPDDSKN